MIKEIGEHWLEQEWQADHMGLPFPHHALSPAAAASSGRELWNVAGCCTREMREAICEGATAGRYFQPAEPHDSPERSRRASGNFFSIACECERALSLSSPHHPNVLICPLARTQHPDGSSVVTHRSACCFCFKVVASRLF